MRKFLTLQNILLLLIIIISLFFRFYNLEQRTMFEWDQERDAEAVWKIVKEQDITLIGPRAVAGDGFYLGPMWYYLLVPFYFIFNMDPLAGSVLSALVGIFTTLAIYYVFKKEFSVVVGFIASILWLFSFDTLAWNPILIPLVSVGVFYFLNRSIPLVLLLIGLAFQLHFQAIFLFVPTLYVLFLKFKERSLSTKSVLLGLGLFALTFTPLIVFDLVHNFVNFNAFVKFFTSNSSASADIPNMINVYFRSFKQFLPELIQLIGNERTGALVLLITLAGIMTSTLNKQKKILYLLFLLPPTVVLSLYKGNVSEYYFLTTTPFLALGIGLLIEKVFRKIISVNYFNQALIILVSIYSIYRIIPIITESPNPYNLNYKKQAVLHIINQKDDPIFNVSYSTPGNFDNGFRYLFKYYGREPQDIPEGHLWTIVIPPDGENVPSIATYGQIGIIRR